MIAITNFIYEKLKINSKTKINTLRYLSNQELSHKFWDNFTARSSNDINEFEIEIKNRFYTPQEFINKVKYKEQLFCYWFSALVNDWEEGYDAFREEIINKKYATEDEIDAAAIEVYDIYDTDDKVKSYCKKYYEKYNFKARK